MTRRFTRLAWAAAACTYLLIVLGAVVRVTGSGLGCGEHWPRCHGRWFPPFDDIGTLIEWNHRLFPGLVPGVRRTRARVRHGAVGRPHGQPGRRQRLSGLPAL